MPSESTFSRAFAEFAKNGCPQDIHEAMVKARYGDKLAGHVSRDATAIHAREKAAAKPEPAPAPERGKSRKGEPPALPPDPTRLQLQLNRGLKENLADLPASCDWGCKGGPPALPPDPTRLQLQLNRGLKENLADLPASCDWGCKGGPPAPPPDPTRLQLQLNRGLKENLADLPASCDWGCKKNSRGKTGCRRGYKAHLDMIDDDIPVSFILTSASLHDSQAAILLAQMTAGRIVNLYDLADAAYDAKEIREMSVRLGHVALIGHNPRRGEKIEFSPAEARRYHERTAVGRVNSHLHEEHGGRNVRVRGPAKVAAHLAFGLLVIAAEQMLRMFP